MRTLPHFQSEIWTRPFSDVEHVLETVQMKSESFTRRTRNHLHPLDSFIKTREFFPQTSKSLLINFDPFCSNNCIGTNRFCCDFTHLDFLPSRWPTFCEDLVVNSRENVWIIRFWLEFQIDSLRLRKKLSCHCPWMAFVMSIPTFFPAPHKFMWWRISQ